MRWGPVLSQESCSVAFRSCKISTYSLWRLPPAELANCQFSVRLTWTRIQSFNRPTFLDFPNVIGPNGSDSDCETSHVAEVVRLKRMYPWFYRQFFYNVIRKILGARLNTCLNGSATVKTGFRVWRSSWRLARAVQCINWSGVALTAPNGSALAWYVGGLKVHEHRTNELCWSYVSCAKSALIWNSWMCNAGSSFLASDQLLR